MRQKPNVPRRYDPRVRKSVYGPRKYIKTVRIKYPKDGLIMAHIVLKLAKAFTHFRKGLLGSG